MATGLVIHISSGEDRHTEILTDERVRIGNGESADLKLRAARPQYCALSNRKLTSLGIEMPPWQDALRRYIQGSVPGAGA